MCFWGIKFSIRKWSGLAESYSRHLNKTGSGDWNISREFSNLWCPVIPDTCSWEDGPRKCIVHVNNLLDWSWVQKLHFRYKDSMNYLSTWITPNEKHWFPQTFPNDNHTVSVEITTIIHLNIPLPPTSPMCHSNYPRVLKFH